MGPRRSHQQLVRAEAMRRVVRRAQPSAQEHLNPSHARILQLQRDAGNAAVSSLFDGKVTSQTSLEATIARSPRAPQTTAELQPTERTRSS